MWGKECLWGKEWREDAAGLGSHNRKISKKKEEWQTGELEKELRKSIWSLYGKITVFIITIIMDVSPFPLRLPRSIQS